MSDDHTPAPEPARNPLASPPLFLTKHEDPDSTPMFVAGPLSIYQRYSGTRRISRIDMGYADEFHVSIYREEQTDKDDDEEPRTQFRWGCRRLLSEEIARRHWRDGVSTRSGEMRPHATALIDYIVEICKYLEWKW